jgi:hypothetical protein
MRDRVTITFVEVVLPEIAVDVISAEQVVGDHRDGVADRDRRPRIEEIRKEPCRRLGVPQTKRRVLHTGRVSCRPGEDASGTLPPPPLLEEALGFDHVRDCGGNTRSASRLRMLFDQVTACVLPVSVLLPG